MEKPLRPTASVGRPKSEEKREAILLAAKSLFLEKGLHGTTMDQVARAGGVSKQTVYSHFKNKESLFKAVISIKVQTYGFDNPVLPGDAVAKDVLAAIGLNFLNLLFDPDVVAMQRVVISESALYPDIAEHFYEAGPEATMASTEKILCELQARGHLKMDDPYNSAVVFLLLLQGKYKLQKLMNIDPKLSENDKERHIKRVVEQFLTLFGR